LSFAGLKTAVLRVSKELKNQKEKHHLAASFQKTIIEILHEKTMVAMEEFSKNKKKTFVIAGGVASNLTIRENLTNLAKENNFTSIFPPINLCSDNAAMIAWAGIERFKINFIDNLEFPSKARWPLDSSAPFLKGPGLKI
jgi:N6-L-threonylcarbamoyladenine synthase